MKYDVITYSGLDDLIHCVNRKLAEGWELAGSLQVQSMTDCTLYIQPIIMKAQHAVIGNERDDLAAHRARSVGTATIVELNRPANLAAM